MKGWCVVLSLCLSSGCRAQQASIQAPPEDLSAVRILVPMNFLTGAPWRLDLGPPTAVSPFERGIRLETGSYTVRELLRQIQEQTRKAVIWHRKLDVTARATDALDRKVFAVGTIAEPDALVRWQAGGQSLSEILNQVLAYMTENGVGLEFPESEVWVAIVDSHSVHLLMLPSSDVEDPVPK